MTRRYWTIWTICSARSVLAGAVLHHRDGTRQHGRSAEGLRVAHARGRGRQRTTTSPLPLRHRPLARRRRRRLVRGASPASATTACPAASASRSAPSPSGTSPSSASRAGPGGPGGCGDGGPHGARDVVEQLLEHRPQQALARTPSRTWPPPPPSTRSRRPRHPPPFPSPCGISCAGFVPARTRVESTPLLGMFAAGRVITTSRPASVPPTPEETYASVAFPPPSPRQPRVGGPSHDQGRDPARRGLYARHLGHPEGVDGVYRPTVGLPGSAPRRASFDRVGWRRTSTRSTSCTCTACGRASRPPTRSPPPTPSAPPARPWSSPATT